MSVTSASPSGNGRTTSNPDTNADDTFAKTVTCFDPENRDLPCPICGGTGVFTLEVVVDDPRYGKFQRCPNHPVEADLEMQNRLRRFGNLEAYKGKTFENFTTALFGGSYTQNVISSLEIAKAGAEAYAYEPSGWVVYEGPYGCGKTHLAVAIANVRIEQFGEQVIFLTAPDLLDFLRLSFAPNADTSYDAYFERVRNVPFLVLDELGAENPSPWAQEKLFQILNFRHVNELPTVITTNTSFDELDPRISSRMRQGPMVKHVKISAPDFRRTARSQALDMHFNNLQIYQHMTFLKFNTHSGIPDEVANLKNAKKVAENWANSPEGWLCLLGEYGCGKTHLAASIANQLSELGRDVMFTTVPDLLDYLRVTFDPRSNARFDKRFHDILDIPILILDDLRLTSATPWAKEKLFQIIDYRYLRGMPTVFTTSETMNSTDQRFATRLMDRRLCYPFAFKVRSYVERMKTQS